MKLNLKNFDKDQALALLITHVEKLVFGVFLIFFVLLCMGALSQKPYENTPDKFVSATQTVETLLSSSNFDPTDPVNEMPVIKPLPTAQVVPEQIFLTHTTWIPPLFDVKKRRPDPRYVPLVDIHVDSGYGAVQLNTAGIASPGVPQFGSPVRAPGTIAAGGRFGNPVGGAPAGGRFGAPAAARTRAGRFADEEGDAPLARGGTPGRFGAPAIGTGAVPTTPDASIKGIFWAAVTGLVPVAEQEKEYRDAFREARFTNPQLDIPEYYAYAVERAEVTPGAAADAPLNWVALDLDKAYIETESFAGSAADPVDPLYEEAILCDRLPPLIDKSPEPWATHPKIPLRAELLNNAAAEVPEQREEVGRFGSTLGTGGGAHDVGGRGLATGRFVGTPVAGGRFGGGVMNAGGRNMGGLNSFADSGPKIDYRLFRFFDFSVQPGKSYRYRVKLILHNPNENVPPQYLAKPDLTKGQVRETQWSDASPPVRISRGTDLLVGGIKRGSGLNENKAEVVLKIWEPLQAIQAARAVEVVRGQMANFAVASGMTEKGFTVNGEPIIDETTGTILGNPPMPVEMAFHGESLVVDMTGGEPLRGSRVASPARLLVLEPDGHMTVKSELADNNRFVAYKSYIKAGVDAAKPPPEEKENSKRRGREDAEENIRGGGRAGLNELNTRGRGR